MFYLKYLMSILPKITKKLRISSQKGFTLIELLVVIGILGILAAALVATIDPFEQLKKANDANVKNTAVEFIDANIRYYTTHTHMPWAAGGCNLGVAPTGVVLYPTLTSCLLSLYNDGEIKGAFTTVTGVLSSIIVTGSAQNVTACFQPLSRSGRSDSNATFLSTGVPDANPTADCGPTSTSCYWCSE